MFGSVDTKKYNIFIDNDLFGTKMMKMNHIASEDYVTICCNDVLKFLTKHKESNVHIIVSTKDEGKWVILLMSFIELLFNRSIFLNMICFGLLQKIGDYCFHR